MKFSIRDLLLVTVIVALAVAWGVDHWRQKRTILEQAREIEIYKVDPLFHGLPHFGVDGGEGMPDFQSSIPIPPKN